MIVTSHHYDMQNSQLTLTECNKTTEAQFKSAAPILKSHTVWVINMKK